MSEAFQILGTPRFGGILVVADHASNRVPIDIDLGIPRRLLDDHIAIDLGVAEVAQILARRPGFCSFLGNVSRLVCDFNRDKTADGLVPHHSDGHAIPGNLVAEREHRVSRFYAPYHEALTQTLETTPQALILSLHSFTPSLASRPDEQRPWQIGVLYGDDDRAARLALPLLTAHDLIVGDQQPYSGKELNATMDRHAEAEGRPYLGIEIRQDQIADAAGQGHFAAILAGVCNAVALALT